MAARNNDPFEPSNSPAGTRTIHPARVMGVVFVVAVVVLPVLFSQGFDQWTSIPTNSPFAATLGYRIVGLPADGDQVVMIDSMALHSNGSVNVTRVDESNGLPAVQPTPGVVRVDLSDGTMIPGPIPPALDSMCCFSNHAFSPDGESIHWTGTEGQGWLMQIEYAPDGSVIKTRIDPTSIFDYTAYMQALLRGWVTFTSSTDSNETVVYANTYTATSSWNRLVSRPSDDVFTNRHSGSTTDPEANDVFVVYPLGTSLNLLKYGVDEDQVLWELFDIVTLGTPPDDTFNYYQVVHDEGHVAVMAPRDNDTVLWYADDAGGLSAPTATQYITYQGTPTGDHQGLAMYGRQVTTIRPNPGGPGAEIRYVIFNADPSVPANQHVVYDEDLTGGWFNVLPNYTVQLINPADPASAAVFDVSGDELFVAVGNTFSDTMDYGTVPRPIYFDGFESNGIYFWNQ
jgi:hypothetical protein